MEKLHYYRGSSGGVGISVIFSQKYHYSSYYNYSNSWGNLRLALVIDLLYTSSTLEGVGSGQKL
jgi:hypothetical protein